MLKEASRLNLKTNKLSASFCPRLNRADWITDGVPPPPQPLISFHSKKDHLEFFNLLSFRNGIIFMKYSRAGVFFLITVREKGGREGGEERGGGGGLEDW